jgi:hypothetical protein
MANHDINVFSGRVRNPPAHQSPAKKICERSFGGAGSKPTLSNTILSSIGIVFPRIFLGPVALAILLNTSTLFARDVCPAIDRPACDDGPSPRCRRNVSCRTVAGPCSSVPHMFRPPTYRPVVMVVMEQVKVSSFVSRSLLEIIRKVL